MLLNILQLTINDDYPHGMSTHGMINGQVRNREVRVLPVGNDNGGQKLSKRKYHGIYFLYFFREFFILFVSCIVSDFLDPINYIFTDSEYYGIPVSYRAKWTILLAVLCLITVISIDHGCHHHYYCHKNNPVLVFHPVFFDLFPHLLLPWMHMQLYP